MDRIDADWAFDRYEAIRAVAPTATFLNRSEHVENLAAVAEHVDAFILDAFGVLNRGETAIPGAVARMKQLRAMGKRLIVLTNAASYPKAQAVEKYARFGFDFSTEEVISSRDVAFAHLPALPDKTDWVAIAHSADTLTDAPLPIKALYDDPSLYDTAGGFIFLSSADWKPSDTARLITALRQNPRPFIIANPDLVAPRETDLSLEPGSFAHDIARATGITPQFFGKPYGNAFNTALKRLEGIDKTRIAMVGDTLHTDILGGAAAGVRTVLITDHGLFAGRDVRPFIERSGIRPDWIIPTT